MDILNLIVLKEFSVLTSFRESFLFLLVRTVMIQKLLMQLESEWSHGPLDDHQSPMPLGESRTCDWTNSAGSVDQERGGPRAAGKISPLGAWMLFHCSFLNLVYSCH